VEQRRRFPIPEIFLGLLAIGAAVVLTAHIAAGAIHDARHTGDTISVTGSARKPITSNLIRWSLTMSADAATAPPAATRLAEEVTAVQAFLRGAGVPAAAISRSVVYSELVVEQLPKHRRLKHQHVSQTLNISTRQINVIEHVSTRVGELIEQDVDVSAAPLEYISTELTQAKLDALRAATEDARRRADILVHGLGGKLGAMRSSSLGVYQITPRDSTDVSNYGINDTSTRDKDVAAVVTATFAVSR
jgi:hypothetical protein